MKSLFNAARPLVVAAGLVVAITACDEQLDSGAACPALCPHQSATMRESTFFAVALDSSVVGFPPQGGESEFFIATMGDTLETAAIVRYDSLPTFFRYTPAADDSLIYAVDSARIVLHAAVIDTVGAPLTLEIYNVDLGGPDDDDPDLAGTALTADRLIGSRTIPRDSVRDSIEVFIDNGVVLSTIQAQQADTAARGLRIAIRVNPEGGNRSQFRMLTASSASAALLRFRPHVDTTVSVVDVFPRSKAPANVFVRALLQDYLVTLREPAPPPADVMRVGSVPGRRIFMQFDIPGGLIDSTNVVRATLELTQRPNPGAPQAEDTVVVREFSIVAGPEVTDLQRRLLFVQRFRDLDSLAVIAGDSAVRAFEMIDLVRQWRGTNPERTPRTLALAVDSEGTLPRLVDFYSSEAPESVRPRLRIFYLPRPEPGLP